MSDAHQAIDRIAADIRALVGAGLTATETDHLIESLQRAVERKLLAQVLTGRVPA